MKILLCFLLLLSLGSFGQSKKITLGGGAGSGSSSTTTLITVGSADLPNIGYTYYCDKTGDQTEINAAITSVSNAGGGDVQLSAGIFSLSGSIVIKDGVNLILSSKTRIQLANSANSYMVRNFDMSAGNSKWSITGGSWEGNGANQTRTYTGTPEATYWGFGFLLKNCSDFVIQNLKITDSNAWGIAHFLCSRFRVSTILFSNAAGPGNGDGISGVGPQDAIIENISGYTNDDLVGIGALSTFFGSLQGHEITGWGTGRDAKNILIRNITGDDCLRLVTLYPTETMTIENVTIENVKGSFLGGGYGFNVTNYWPGKTGKGFVKNLNIRDVNIKASEASVIGIKFSDYSLMDMDYVNIDNFHLTTTVNSAHTLFYELGAAKFVNISNVGVYNSGGTTKSTLATITRDRTTKVSIKNVDRNSHIDPVINITTGSGTVGIDAPECYLNDMTLVAGVTGDRLLNPTGKHPMVFFTNWLDLITGSTLY